MPMTPAESDLILLLGWQSYDWLLHFLTTASKDELEGAKVVWNPDSWIEKRKGTAIFSRDAVPIYLDPATGKIIVSVEQLTTLRERSKILQEAKEQGKPVPENFVYQPATDAQGSSRKD